MVQAKFLPLQNSKLITDLNLTKPINVHGGQNQPDNFDEILQLNAWEVKYLKEECQSEHYQKLSFKYFVKSCLVSKFMRKVLYRQTTISARTLMHQLVSQIPSAMHIDGLATLSINQINRVIVWKRHFKSIPQDQYISQIFLKPLLCYYDMSSSFRSRDHSRWERVKQERLVL